MSDIPTVDYEEVRAIQDDPSILLIDVREPHELEATGAIPGSINIPLGQVEDVLKNLSESEFAAKFGRDKPTPDFPLVFHCQAGKRGATASAAAMKLGYSNVRNYAGAWADWAKRSQQ